MSLCTLGIILMFQIAILEPHWASYRKPNSMNRALVVLPVKEKRYHSGCNLRSQPGLSVWNRFRNSANIISEVMEFFFLKVFFKKKLSFLSPWSGWKDISTSLSGIKRKTQTSVLEDRIWHELAKHVGLTFCSIFFGIEGCILQVKP